MRVGIELFQCPLAIEESLYNKNVDGTDFFVWGYLYWPCLAAESSMNFVNKKSFALGTSLVVQGLRLYIPSAGDWGLIPGQRSKVHSLQLKNSKDFACYKEEGKGYPLQYSGLENSMGWTGHGIAKSQTRLSNLRFHFQGRWKIPHAAKLVQLNKLKKKKALLCY